MNASPDFSVERTEAPPIAAAIHADRNGSQKPQPRKNSRRQQKQAQAEAGDEAQAVDEQQAHGSSDGEPHQVDILA